MNDKTFYIISQDILTDGMKKTLKAKELLENNQASTISQATQMVGLSRPSFYRYKDNIYKTMPKLSNIVSIYLFILDHSGVLSNVLNTISHSNANILTINQEIPLGQNARVSLYIKTKHMNIEIHHLINQLNSLEGVIEAKFSNGDR